jgi:hypothetical protein
MMVFREKYWILHRQKSARKTESTQKEKRIGAIMFFCLQIMMQNQNSHKFIKFPLPIQKQRVSSSASRAPDSSAARANKFSDPRAIKCTEIDIDPALSPNTVTRCGSPPNAAMFFCTHAGGKRKGKKQTERKRENVRDEE